MQAAFLYKEQIKDDIIFLSQTKKQKGSERNILNKWFQDSIKNYFLETYASPFLKNELGEGFVKKVKQNIEKRMQSDGLKFMNLLNQYKIELEAFGKATKFVNSLISIVIDDQKLERGSALWAKQAKKKFVALMLIVLMEYNESRVSSFYDMWNYIFPSETQIKKKLSKDDKLRLKCVSQISTTSSLKNSPPLTQRSISSPVNSNTTLRYHYKHLNQPLQQQNALIRTNFPDSSSQCSRACEFQELDGAQVIKKFQLDTKQEAEQFYQNSHPQIFHRPYHIQQTHQNQNQHQITQHQPAQFQFVTTQPFNAIKQQEIVLRQAQNPQSLAQHSTQIGNTTFINNPDIFRRMSTVFSIKQDITDSEMINLDDQQFFIDRQDDGNSAISVQQAPSYSQASQFSFEPHNIFQNIQHHQQPQVQPNTFKQSLYEHNPQPHGNQIGLTVHLTNQPTQLAAISQQPSTGQSHGSNNGYFYSNNVDINSYFNVDQLFAQSGFSSNQHNF